MRAQDKPKYVKEARELLNSIDISTLIYDPNELKILGKISPLTGIFTNFSYNDGEELRRLLLAFQMADLRFTPRGVDTMGYRLIRDTITKFYFLWFNVSISKFYLFSDLFI